MGFHICEYCSEVISSGDVTLSFESGNTYTVPDMIVHYVEDHNYQPSNDFIRDILGSNLKNTNSYRVQTKGITTPVGYLSGDYPSGITSDKFKLRLRQLIERATQLGNRGQTRSI